MCKIIIVPGGSEFRLRALIRIPPSSIITLYIKSIWSHVIQCVHCPHERPHMILCVVKSTTKAVFILILMVIVALLPVIHSHVDRRVDMVWLVVSTSKATSVAATESAPSAALAVAVVVA